MSMREEDGGNGVKITMQAEKESKWAFRGQGEWAELQSLVLMLLISKKSFLSAYFFTSKLFTIAKSMIRNAKNEVDRMNRNGVSLPN